MAYIDEVLADGPVAYWALDETSGTVAADAQGTYPGSYSGSPTLGASSLLPAGGGTAMALDGVDDRLSVPHNNVFNGSAGSAFAIECWLKIANPTADALQVIADKTNLSVATNNQYYLIWENRSAAGSPRRIRFVAGDAAILDWGGDAAANAVAAGGHLVARKNGDQFALFWNGTLVSSTTDASHYWYGTSLPLTFGSTTGGAYFLGGKLDAVAFYNYALSDARIAAHYAAASSQASQGSLAGTLPGLQGAFAGSVSAPSGGGTLAGSLPRLVGSFGGTVAASAATLAGSLPGLTGSFTADVPVPAISSSSEYANYGYNYGGLGFVEFDTPIAPTPTRVRREVVRRVHQSLPAPTLVDGRPV